MYPKTYLEIIKEICAKHSISIRSFPYEPIIKLEKDNNIHYIWSRRFDLNSSVSVRIADNKFATYIILHSFNIPTIECLKIARIDTEEYTDSKMGNIEVCQKC